MRLCSNLLCRISSKASAHKTDGVHLLRLKGIVFAPAQRAKVMMFGQMPSVITAGNMFLGIAAAAAEYYSSSPSRRGNCDGKCRLLVIAFAVSMAAIAHIRQPSNFISVCLS
jgi:hypothetical protein